MITVIGSLKGGSGKSTVTFNLAIWLAMAGRNVLAIDADPQATLSDVMEVRRDEGFEPLVDVLTARGLSEHEQLIDRDEIVIDVGTADMIAMQGAIRMADRVVVPVPPSQADIWSAQRFLGYVDRMVEGHDPPEIVGFINRADTHHAIRESDEAAAALVALPNFKFLKPRLSQRTVYRRSFSEGLAVFEQDPRGKAAQEWFSLVSVLYPDTIS